MNNDASMITITTAEYAKLNQEQQLLEALRACGIDNWDGYDNAIELVKEWDEEDA